MIIGLHDADMEHLNKRRHKKVFPNYALMKISAYHKALGDTVEWWNSDKEYDKVYSSKIFDFTPENPLLPSDTVKGGTGYGLFTDLPKEIDDMFPDYSIYPDCDYAIGYITRGCPNNCRWCVVPHKEGAIRPYRIWEQLARPDSNKLVLMDNNILACDYGIEQLKSLIDSGYKIDLNQGMDARLVNDSIAAILANLKWIKYIRFSCDTIPQIEAIHNAAALLEKYGVKPYRLFIYLLVTENIENAECRVEQLKKLKGMPQSVKCFSVSENNISTLKAEFEKNGIEYQFVGGKDGKISCIYPAEYAEQVAVIKEDYKRTFDEVSEHFSVIADVPETERQAEITARIDELTNAEIGSEQRSEVYSTILSDMQSRDVELPEYSENNMRIISGEMPNATQMAGKAFWEQQGYELNEGAKGVEIVAPQMDENGNPVLDENGNQTFTNVTVYDISETNAYETAIRDELNSLHNEYAVERAAALAKADITEITVADDLSGESVTLTADKLTKEQVSAALQENLGYSAEKADIAANKVCYDLNLDRKVYFAKPTQIDNINALRTNIRYQSDDITIRDTRFDAVNFKDGEDTHIILRHGDSSIGLTPAKMSKDEMKKMCVSQLGMSEYQADKAVSKAVKIESQIRSKLEERTVNKQGISQEMYIERTGSNVFNISMGGKSLTYNFSTVGVEEKISRNFNIPLENARNAVQKAKNQSVLQNKIQNSLKKKKQTVTNTPKVKLNESKGLKH